MIFASPTGSASPPRCTAQHRAVNDPAGVALAALPRRDGVDDVDAGDGVYAFVDGGASDAAGPPRRLLAGDGSSKSRSCNRLSSVDRVPPAAPDAVDVDVDARADSGAAMAWASSTKEQGSTRFIPPVHDTGHVVVMNFHG